VSREGSAALLDREATKPFDAMQRMQSRTGTYLGSPGGV
jgi:hypothetical protein